MLFEGNKISNKFDILLFTVTSTVYARQDTSQMH